MPVHLQRELQKIKQTILSLGAMVEDRVHKAGKIIKSRDSFDSARIIREDYEVDEMEIEIEEECLKILALYQPVAADLRFIIAVIKINNDLERIADEAVNIARRVEIIAKNKNSDFAFDYSPMVEEISVMLRKSLDSLVRFDTDLAYKVCLMDEDVDKIHKIAYDMIKENMRKNPDSLGCLINYFLISRHLERIGDHATNIAEEVIYMTDGDIVRHGKF